MKLVNPDKKLKMKINAYAKFSGSSPLLNYIWVHWLAQFYINPWCQAQPQDHHLLQKALADGLAAPLSSSSAISWREQKQIQQESMSQDTNQERQLC